MGPRWPTRLDPNPQSASEMTYPEGTMTVPVQFVTQLYLTLCDPMDCSTPGFPVHHQLLKPAQIHVHQVGDAIQSTLSSVIPFSSCLQPFPASGCFSNESALPIKWPKYWSFSFSISPSNEYSGLIFFRMDLFDRLEVQRDPQESSPTPQLKSINSSALNFLYSPTLTSTHDYWKNNSFD